MYRTMTKAKSHLLKHEVPDAVDSTEHFGTDDKKEIARLVTAMGQRQLQVGPAKTFSLHSLRRTLRGAQRGIAGAAASKGALRCETASEVGAQGS